MLVASYVKHYTRGRGSVGARRGAGAGEGGAGQVSAGAQGALIARRSPPRPRPRPPRATLPRRSMAASKCESGRRLYIFTTCDIFMTL